MNHIGLDIGGTSIKGILTDSKFSILKSILLPSHSEKAKEATINNIVEAIKQLSTGKEPVGISMAGRINKGTLTFCPNIPKLQGLKLKKILENKTGTEIFIENDASCFAIAEHKIGAGKGTKNMIGLIIGTGIGAGIIINNELYKGNGYAGELGHAIIDPSGTRCGCGKKGDFESWCSGKHITERYAIAGGKIKNPEPKKIFASKEKTAKKISLETIDKLGIALSNIICYFDPEAIVIGGGVSNLKFYSQIRNAIVKYSYKRQAIKTKIKKSALILPGALGAAMLTNHIPLLPR